MVVSIMEGDYTERADEAYQREKDLRKHCKEQGSSRLHLHVKRS